MHTKHALHSVDHFLIQVRIIVIVIVAPLHTGWDPIRVYLCHCACLTFFSRSTSMHVAQNSCCVPFVGYIFRSKNWACKGSGLTDVRM